MWPDSGQARDASGAAQEEASSIVKTARVIVLGLLLGFGAARMPSNAEEPTKSSPAPRPLACTGAKYHYLDFWLGDWTAFIPAGGPLPDGTRTETEIQAANARVEAIVDGCGYLEHWDSVPLRNGHINRGKGIHRYDSQLNRWCQLWISNSGKENTSVGQPFEGGVRYVSKNAESGDKSVRERQTIVPLPDGNVRNYGESSVDEGKTWSVNYDFVYRRK